jgi:hypothetical protein
MPILHVFLAHPKNIEDAAIDALKARAERAVQAAVNIISPGTTARIVTGRDDFMARSQSEGGWDPWCASVARGMTYRDNTLQPRYHVIVVAPSPLFGKGTSKIVSEAIRCGKPVYYLRESGALLPVSNVIEHDGNDWQNGWAVQVRENG